MSDTPIPVTFFTSHAAMNKNEARYTMCELAQRIFVTTAQTKGELPWLKLARFGNHRTDKGSLRHDPNVLAVTGIEADCDDERVTVDEALEILTKQGVASILYTSPTHTEDAHRWRVLCPLSAEVKPDQRRHFLGRLNGLFRGIFAGESFTLRSPITSALSGTIRRTAWSASTVHPSIYTTISTSAGLDRLAAPPTAPPPRRKPVRTLARPASWCA